MQRKSVPLQHQISRKVRRVNVMDVTYSNRMKMMAAAMFIGVASLFMASCTTSEEDYDKVIHPDKEIVPIHGEKLALLGGGIHCVTQQQPVFY